jgi:hypothetical protein
MHDETKKMFLKENVHNPDNRDIINDLAKPGYKTLSEREHRRFIKTHLPLSLLPKNIWTSGAKVTYI